MVVMTFMFNLNRSTYLRSRLNAIEKQNHEILNQLKIINNKLNNEVFRQ